MGVAKGWVGSHFQEPGQEAVIASDDKPVKARVASFILGVQFFEKDSDRGGVKGTNHSMEVVREQEELFWDRFDVLCSPASSSSFC